MRSPSSTLYVSHLGIKSRPLINGLIMVLYTLILLYKLSSQDFDLAPLSKKQKLNESIVGEEVKSQQILNGDPAQHTVSNIPILSVEEPGTQCKYNIP